MIIKAAFDELVEQMIAAWQKKKRLYFVFLINMLLVLLL